MELDYKQVWIQGEAGELEYHYFNPPDKMQWKDIKLYNSEGLLIGLVKFEMTMMKYKVLNIKKRHN